VKTLFLFLVASIFAVPFVWAQESFGTIRATTRLRPDGTKCTTIIDPEKHTAEETLLDSKDKVLKKTTYLLGDNDVAVGAIFRDAKGNVIYKATYQRDAAGHVTEAAFNAPDGRYLGKRVFIYGSGGDTSPQVVDYDANGQQIAQAQPAAPKTGKKRR
jgi:hypothetical protein